MIDHLGIAVPDFAASKKFYLEALAPLGIGVVMNVPKEESGAPNDFTGFGAEGKPFFWIGQGVAPQGMHLCFTAQTRAAVDAFYKAALAGGARDNGPPGIRAHYHPNYYGAFVIDLNGVNLEAVCHKPA
ncbi:glyoxalase [Steroidobacter agaridevorans]|uniref:Glyoxalase n=1 Tax=Steroidobacter agaridevorans TaxID=2695856 RepID=A0A829YM09_9GAMM|nr:VOC family protein [Steroidobacter agaridevorans]GFE83872.1 glyoxalase [Steroidobacter agaridevorans]GFE91541.1 glyoxalase [Steroidobacter agaridevorans]